MKSYPTTRFVFDRKKNASRVKEALVQIEVLLNGKKKYIGTGVRVRLHEWDDKKHIVRREDTARLNSIIDAKKNAIDRYIDACREGKRVFTWDAIEEEASRLTNGISFPDWVDERIASRADIRDSTKKTHKKLPVSLLEFGKITSFSDLTKANVRGYYNWLQSRTTQSGKRIAQATVWSYMKFLRVYVHEAMACDLIDSDPLVGLKVKKGESQPYRWLTEEEMDKLEKTPIKNKSYSRVRDLFIFQCYTGLAYTDLMDMSAKKIESDGEYEYIIGRRLKTNEEYVVLLLPQAKAILEKYDYELPRYTNQQYNKRLKYVAGECGISKPIASHWGRRTAGMLLLNNGVRLEVVSRVLGHSSVKTTEACYASILRKTVVSEMRKMIKGKDGEKDDK